MGAFVNVKNKNIKHVFVKQVFFINPFAWARFVRYDETIVSAVFHDIYSDYIILPDLRSFMQFV